MYGIGHAMEGINRGFEQHRQISRQEADDEQRRKLQEAQLENYGLRADSTRQKMEHADTRFGQQTQVFEQAQTDRELGELQSQIPMYYQAGDYEALGDALARVAGYEAGDIGEDEEGNMMFFAGNRDEEGNFNPALAGQLEPGELERLSLAKGDWGNSMKKWKEQLAALEAQNQEAEQARLEHERALQEEALKRGTIQGRISEDGRFGISNAPEGETGDPTANQRDVTDISEAFGISRAEAWRMVQTARQEHPAKAIREIAADLSRNSYEYRNDPDAAYDRATELYQRINQGVGYGVTANPPPSDDPLDQVTQRASREIKGQQAEQMLAEAEELARENPNDVARIAGLLVREGVLSEQQAQEWQRTHKGGQSGIGLSAFDQWQQR